MLDQQRRSVGFRATKTRDRSPLGGLLAAGSGDWQARICTSFSRRLMTTSAELHLGVTGHRNFE